MQGSRIRNAIFSLAKELERTQKLLNALEYVIIPQYQDAIYFIKATLEEHEREEFVRLKKVKVGPGQEEDGRRAGKRKDMTEEISSYFEKAKAELKAEHDSMGEKIKGDIAASKRKALSKI